MEVSGRGQPMGFLEFLDESVLQLVEPKEKKVQVTETKKEKDVSREDKSMEREDRRSTYVESFEDLPASVQKQIRKAGIEVSELTDHSCFEVLLNVLRFATKQTFKLKKKSIEKQPSLDAESDDGWPVMSLTGWVDTDSTAPPALLLKTDESLILESNPKKLFKNVEFSGKGGFGRVFFAQTFNDKQKVAIKKMSHTTEKEILSNLSEIGWLTLLRHPNIVTYICGYRVKREIWLVMEFMEGGTLTEAVKGHDFKETQIAYVAKEILKGLKYMHDRKFAHRDLKSSNVMMTVHGDVKLIDFGLCVDTTNGNKHHMVGSPFWMPPEMIQSKPHGCSADIWSFAVCILELALGAPPNYENKVKAMYTAGTVGLSASINPTWTPEFQSFLSNCLKVNPEERATAAELLEHPFLQKTDTRQTMETILTSIFLHRSLGNSGMFG